MSSLDDLSELAQRRGVYTEFTDGRDEQVTVSPDTLMAVLNSLHDMPELRTPDDAALALREVRLQQQHEVVEPVYVVDEGVDAVVALRMGRRMPHYQCRIEFEFGGDVAWAIDSDDLTPLGQADDRLWGLRLPAMRVGYHRLCLNFGRRTVWSTLIVRPLHARTNRFGDDWRAYSVQAPIFSLHSERSWGSGDVADLDEFARLVSFHGASVVATLPLLSSFGPSDFESSPYRPVSRRFWNDRWIALDQVDFLTSSSTAQHLMNEVYGPEHRRAWASGASVDGEASFLAKRNVIQAWASTQSEFMALYEKGLRSYVMEHPEVNDYARFRAAGEIMGRDFHSWPTTARSGLLRWNDVDPTLVRYHLFAQWIIDQQMTTLSSQLAQRGQTLQLDIPIGVHPDGYDVWKSPDEWIHGFSIGSPVDPVTVDGQSWGAPPPHPTQCRTSAHQQFRDALRCHMRVAGVVRLDHVMGLQRLFWVPSGGTAREGTYVKMPFHELLAIVAIEAQRFGADVVGEDLGNVDHELRVAMQHEGLRRMYVAQYAIGEHELASVPAGSVASFGTHDTPTFWGWWVGGDIDERVAIGHLSELDGAEAQQRREHERRRLIAILELDLEASAADVFEAIHWRLGESEAGLVMVQIEDLLGQRRAVNLPGTSDERENWSQPTALSLEEMASTMTLADALEPLRESRGRGTTSGTSSAVTRLSADDLHLFNEGRNFRLYEQLGSHPMIAEGVAGSYFAVWAPNAQRVSVVGDFNEWDGSRHPLYARDSSGVWEGFVPGVELGHTYKYRIRSSLGGQEVDKADPMAQLFEVPSRTASRIWESQYQWGDDEWLDHRSRVSLEGSAVSTYEMHLGSWRRVPEEGNRSLTYRELAAQLPQYLLDMGFTQVEFLPVMEHPFYGSWGYQTTGYFAPTARQGSPDDLRYLIDSLHQAGIGVIIDWVPSHFPSDVYALGLFDGTHLYEHADVRQRVHPDWQSWTFNYSRNEVRSFLISSASYWIEQFHADGLRVDAVASMLYLDYSRGPGQWVPNRFGGREDLDAIDFLRQVNDHIRGAYPGVVMVAEESTSWPGVTHRSDEGGLGFTFKWDMGWMHDTLGYLAREGIYRRFHQGELTFRAMYAAHERFLLPLSHDEVVHGKGSLLAKMSGDDWQKFANLRLLLGYQYTLPGKKLLFMGAEFAQRSEWNHDSSLDWHLLDAPAHEGVRQWVRQLNALYLEQPGLHSDDASWTDFDWLACDDAENSVVIWRRGQGEAELVMVGNFTSVPRVNYEVRLPVAGTWQIIANSDDLLYGGSGHATGAPKNLVSTTGATVSITLPPLSMLVLQRKA